MHAIPLDLILVQRLMLWQLRLLIYYGSVKPIEKHVNIHIDRIKKDVDVDKLIFCIRDELDSHATRTIGYLRG
jgi:hypothetical protein